MATGYGASLVCTAGREQSNIGDRIFASLTDGKPPEARGSRFAEKRRPEGSRRGAKRGCQNHFSLARSRRNQKPRHDVSSIPGPATGYPEPRALSPYGLGSHLHICSSSLVFSILLRTAGYIHIRYDNVDKGGKHHFFCGFRLNTRRSSSSRL
jgi:hypothetical protein